MKKMTTLVLGLFAVLTTAANADSIIDGRTFHALTDCNYALHWPTVQAGKSIQAAGERCKVDVEISDNGKLTYTTQGETFTGYVENQVKKKLFNKEVIVGVLFYFKELKGVARPLTLGKSDATVLNTGMPGFTLTVGEQVITPPVEKPNPYEGKVYKGIGDCSFTDQWYKALGTMWASGERCEVTITLDKKTFTYTTTKEDEQVTRVEETGRYQVVGNEIRFFFGEDNKTTYRPTWIQPDGSVVLVKKGLKVKPAN